jgi:hypothetical protein
MAHVHASRPGYSFEFPLLLCVDASQLKAEVAAPHAPVGARDSPAPVANPRGPKPLAQTAISRKNSPEGVMCLVFDS